MGRYGQAVRGFTMAIELRPRDARAHLGLARIMATCQDANFRDGQKAVARATRALELTSPDNLVALDTLAAACAESGRFEQAVKWQTKAVELAPPGAKDPLRSRLRLYQAQRPYRQGPTRP